MNVQVWFQFIEIQIDFIIIDIPKAKDLAQKEVIENRAEIKKLKEQIYMIRVKNEILLDTVGDTQVYKHQLICYSIFYFLT